MSALAVGLVLLPVIWLGVLYRLDYEIWFSPTFSRVCGLVSLTVYVIVVGTFGVGLIDSRVTGLAWGAYEYRTFAIFTLLPGISLGIILFPETAAGYSQHYLNLISVNQLSSFAVIGWALLILSVVWGVAWYAAS